MRSPISTTSPPYSPTPKPSSEPFLMLPAISDMCRRSLVVTPRTMAPVTWVGPSTMAWASTIGAAWITPGAALIRRITVSRSGPLIIGDWA